MKGSRLVDVLDDKVFNKKQWDIINKNGLDEIRDDITTIQWQINLNMGD